MHLYKNLFNLANRVAVVTGAAGILGSEFSKALCEFGASVICIDSDEHALNELGKYLSDEYGKNKVMHVLCDISNSKDVRHFVERGIKKFKKIDILLNNAATKTNNLSAFFSSFTEYSIDIWREVMSVNLDGMFLVAQAVGREMILNKSGTIIQTASIYGPFAPDQRIYNESEYLNQKINTPAVYTASKAGVIGLTKHLSALWGEYGVRVNALCPGGVSSGQNTTFQEKYSARVPMGRMAEKIDIVGPMLFLASEASSYVTGQVIFADGGLSVW